MAGHNPFSLTRKFSVHVYDRPKDRNMRVISTIKSERERVTDEASSNAADYTPSKLEWRSRIQHFTWPWFSVTMSTGALAHVLATTPFRFTGLDTIGLIFFMLDLILFAAFNIAIGIRFYLAPSKLFISLHHPVESLFFSAYFVSVSLLLSCLHDYAVPHVGVWLVQTIRVLFWIYVSLGFAVAVFQYYILFQLERLRIRDALPAWIFPIYPLLVSGSLAGLLAPNQPQYKAFPIWVAGVAFQGLGWCVAIMTYTLYSQRLMTSALPSPPARPGMYVSVGPTGYTAAALVQLGQTAPQALAADLFAPLSVPASDIVKVLGIISGIFICILGFWFFAVSTTAVLVTAKHMRFTLSWWAFVFPNAGLTLAVIEIGNALNSDGIKGVSSAMTLLLVVAWLGTAVAHVRALWRGDILQTGKDEDVDIEDDRWTRDDNESTLSPLARRGDSL